LYMGLCFEIHDRSFDPVPETFNKIHGMYHFTRDELEKIAAAEVLFPEVELPAVIEECDGL
jgi:hypothetical protein